MEQRDERPLVGIIMGSESDLPAMTPAAEVLRLLDVAYELTIVSAHRTPERMFEYAKGAKARGLKLIIAGAGGAAHLPGMVAALTILPVIGVPVRSKTLDGLDSLLSIAQMPGGVPVATVAIDGGKNAGLLAARILACADEGLAGRLAAYARSTEEAVLSTAARLDRMGPADWAGLDGRSPSGPEA